MFEVSSIETVLSPSELEPPYRVASVPHQNDRQ